MGSKKEEVKAQVPRHKWPKDWRVEQDAIDQRVLASLTDLPAGMEHVPGKGYSFEGGPPVSATKMINDFLRKTR